ncbi:MAG: hypothetical protein QOE11_1406 [Solirubrobacteraceae bacterium]|nr:hypothetical protein [Solirubrobacteraceae bacterium]
MPDAPADDDWEPAPDDDLAAAPRARRRLVTPVTSGLAALLLATAGFIAGVEVQKGQGASAGAAAATPNPRGAPAGGGAAAPGGGGQAPTFGSVANKKGSTLYVTTAAGTTVRVKTNAQSKVTRNAAAGPHGIYPGDTVVVQGTKDRDGNLVATQISATSKTAGASGGGFARAFGGGGGGGGAPGGAGAGAGAPRGG